MELVEMVDAWVEYSGWTGDPEMSSSSSLPPEGVFVSESGSLMGGCCIYPSPGSMVVGHIETHPGLSEANEARVLRFMLRVLDGHRVVTNRFMFVDMVWAEDKNGLLMHRIEAPSGKHGILETTAPAPEGLTSSETGDIGAAAKNALAETKPTNAPAAKKSGPKKATKARRKARARKKEATDD